MPPENIGNPKCKSDDHLTVAKIIKHYKNHPSIEIINKICTKKENFDVPTATAKEINNIIKELSLKKQQVLIRFHQKLLKRCLQML